MKPPTDKQVRYAEFLAKKTGRELPKNWRLDQNVCGTFIWLARSKLGPDGHRNQHPQFAAEIAALPEWGQNWCANSQYVDRDILRILAGGPLKHDSGPWDEGWRDEQETKVADLDLLAELRAKGL